MKKFLTFVLAALASVATFAGTLSCAEAVDIAKDLEPNTPSEDEYIVEGYVVSVIESSATDLRFWMADDAAAEEGTFEAWMCTGDIVNKGDKVTVTGYIQWYVNQENPEDQKAEIAGGTVVVVEPAPVEYKYTEYENWQIKYGNTWEWSDNMEKVEDGLFKLEVYWEGTGINVKSDENPIKKDWFAPEELILGEEVIAPVNVDVYLKVVDDETVMIGLGVIPTTALPTFNVTVPAGTDACYLVGSMNSWSIDEPVAMTKVDDTHYTYTAESDLMGAEYKYVHGADWAKVEKAADGSEMGNRVVDAEVMNDTVERWADATGLFDVKANATADKFLYNGQLMIRKDGKTYNAMGAEVTK